VFFGQVHHPGRLCASDFTHMNSLGVVIGGHAFDHPKPKGQAAEPLLSFPNGALVHFAVSNREVHMTTRLDGTNTEFLPFNQGDHGATRWRSVPNSARLLSGCCGRSKDSVG
jgi:hypothetical protein